MKSLLRIMYGRVDNLSNSNSDKKDDLCDKEDDIII
jgi:hypothetical protein